MHTVELLDEALAVAQRMGFKIRQEWLSGSGGPCEIKGQRWLFVDLSLPPLEQLDQVIAAIKLIPVETPVSPGLRRLCAA